MNYTVKIGGEIWEGPPIVCFPGCLDQSRAQMIEGQYRGWCMTRQRWCRIEDYKARASKEEPCDLP